MSASFPVASKLRAHAAESMVDENEVCQFCTLKMKNAGEDLRKLTFSIPMRFPPA